MNHLLAALAVIVAIGVWLYFRPFGAAGQRPGSRLLHRAVLAVAGAWRKARERRARQRAGL